MAAAGGLLILAAACAGQGAGDVAHQSANAGSAQKAAATVSVKSGVLVDAKGRTLYSPEHEAKGMIRCTNTCTSIWPPLLASGTPKAGSGLTGTLATVTRSDGKRQVTYNGKPLYIFSLDKQPGATTGDGATDSFGGQSFHWHAVTASGAPASSGGGGSSSSGGGPYNY
jgi:predicted lipoprotein with Yx(FWY)xxD motif